MRLTATVTDAAGNVAVSHADVTVTDPDRTDEVQALIDSTPDGATLELPAGRFRVDGTLTVRDRRDLTIAGAGFVSFTDLTGQDVGIVNGTGTSARPHWFITGGARVTLTGVRVEGPARFRDADRSDFAAYREVTAFEHAFAIQGAADDVTIADVSFVDVHGDGIYVGGTGAPCTNVTIRGVQGVRPARQSMGVVNVHGLLVEDVTIDYGGRSGLDIEPNHSTHFVRNVMLRRVTMGSKFYPFVIGGNTDTIRRENITLEDCEGRHAISSHPAVLATRNGAGVHIIRHRDLRQRSPYGLILSVWTDVNITDSEVTSGRATPTTYGVMLRNCTAPLTLTGNTFAGEDGDPDELFLADQGTDPAVIVHTGNTWANGTKAD